MRMRSQGKALTNSNEVVVHKLIITMLFMTAFEEASSRAVYMSILRNSARKMRRKLLKVAHASSAVSIGIEAVLYRR